MRLSLIAVGQRMPAWIQQGFGEYAQRLKARLPINLIEVPAVKRGSGDVVRAMEEEGRRLLAAVKPDHYVVALDERGRTRTSVELSQWLGKRLQEGRDLGFLVGGADGFAPAVLERLVNDAHASAADLADDLEVPDTLRFDHGGERGA